MVSPFDTCFEAWKSANPFCWAHATLGQSAMASKSRILCVEAWHFDDISRKRWHAKSRRKNEFLEKHITIIFVEENQGGSASLHPSPSHAKDTVPGGTLVLLEKSSKPVSIYRDPPSEFSPTFNTNP